MMKTLLLTGLLAIPCAFAGTDDAARGLIQRVVPQHAGQFVVEAIPPDAGKDVFEIESRNGKIVLRGDNGVSIASALNHYLKNVTPCQLSWCGDQLTLPATLPAVPAKVRVVCPHPYWVMFNYCTLSYSCAWWDWARWERELDFLAMNGINTPLGMSPIQQGFSGNVPRLLKEKHPDAAIALAKQMIAKYRPVLEKAYAPETQQNLAAALADAASPLPAGAMFAADETSYNMPPAVAGTMEADAVMTKMETAVSPEVLKDFQIKNASHYWLFGEDRRFPVRANTIPAHWFEKDAKHFRAFAGTARPGEFYVFQVGVIHADNGLSGNEDFETQIKLPGARIEYLTNIIDINSRPKLRRHKDGEKMMVIWLGVHVPASTKKGTYRGQVIVQGVPEKGLALTLKVEGPPLKDEGVDDAWRLARLKWLNSKIGHSEKIVTQPFTNIKVDESKRTLDILGRRLTLGETGIPSQFTSYFSASNTRILKEGKNAFTAAPKLTSVTHGVASELTGKRFKFTKQSPVAVEWEAFVSNASCGAVVIGRLEYDGFLSLRMTPSASGKPANGLFQIDDMALTIPFEETSATYAMGLGLKGGLRPDSHQWQWKPEVHQDAVWLGNANIGTMFRFKGPNYQRPLINAYYDFRPLNLPESWGAGDISWQRTGDTVEFKARTGRITAQGMPSKDPDSDLFGSFPALEMDWYLTPFKPLNVKQHFTDRYYHTNQGGPLEDPAKLKADGANIVEIHHNRLCNPYINYPFNDDSFGHLQDFVKKAHADDVRVNLYYTTRELTQNLPEFFALKSMAGEIILPRKDGVAWPVTNPNGPHPWLLQHVGNDIVPAWRENLKFPEYKQKLDLAVITTPDSRWNNFYLEGLDYLIKHAAIDGLYIDDTALDRKSMQRARRILDADGNTGRRVSMHSWNHFNGLAKWSNSSIAFMELYPYYDGLWHGEGFNADSSPEFMLVEMSGIPYGLMSEMLDHPNPWHGMVFGMRTRWPWSGDPRNIWKLEDRFGIADSEYIAWWDPACPVKTDNPQVKASVYQKNGATLIALASWAPSKTKVKLAVDWRVLGLAPGKTTLWAPACEGFQSECVFAAEAAIPVAPGKGWLLIADEQPRPISPPDVAADPFRGMNRTGGIAAPFDIGVPANTVRTADLAWLAGATAVVARLDPLQDEGQSWGVGLALGWENGKYVQINMRTDGHWGVHRNGAELLLGCHLKGKPAVVAIRLGEKSGQIMAKEDGGDEWNIVAEFSRAEFPGAPSTVRYGKIGTSWKSADHGDKGSTHPCRVEWVGFY